MPLIVNRQLTGIDPARRWRNFDAFDLALNHVALNMPTPYRREAMRIGGEKVGTDRSGERCIDVFNPYTAPRIGSVPKATRRGGAPGVRDRPRATAPR